MVSKIRLLSEDVVGKIAAGEVVERPASVVKELLENSIDAGADSIIVELEDSGSALIRIADNGEGMKEEDVKIACLRHATSKIRDVKDLENIHTLGFRGEALASIAAVSLMEITSCDGTADQGVYAYLEGGKIRKMSPAGRAQGTTIEIRNLFYNVPARRKFLRKGSTELAAVTEVLTRFIVSYPGIEFKLSHGAKTLIHTTKEMDLFERIRCVMGEEIAGELTKIEFSRDRYSVSGYVSRPASTRKDKNLQMFFVNRRYVRSKFLSDAVQDSYESLVERGRYPAAILFVSVDPGEVDVNVHPMKLLVKFSDEKPIRNIVVGAIKTAFNNLRGSVSLGQMVTAGRTNTDFSSETPVLRGVEETQKEFPYNAFEEKKGGAILKDGAKEAYRVVLNAGHFEEERLMQIGGCYIAKIEKDGLSITDQHAAHERILYEYFSKAVKGMSGNTQNLLFPIRIDISASETVLMEGLLDGFRALGFEIGHFGGNTYTVEAVPAILKDKDIKKVICDVLSDLTSSDRGKVDPLEELIKRMACRAAVKAGDSLNSKEMGVLLEDLTKCDLPFTCPHGRPTMLKITVDELEKRFHRK